MNILIVDDQVDIVRGIIKALNWEELGIEEFYSAYNIVEAKEILMKYSVSIMLCDIEMPNGSGIELLRWVNFEGIPVECIFLTAHAEFEYAQEAIKLGSVDYIVQPAPYEEIQKALSRVIAAHNNKSKILELSNYGAYWKKQDKELSDVFLKKFLLRRTQDCQPVIERLKKIGYVIERDTPVIPVLIHMLGFRRHNNEWEEGLLQSTLDNVLYELFEVKEKQYFSTQLDSMNYVGIFKEIWNVEVGKLNYFVEFFVEKLNFEIVCYVGNEVLFENINDEIHSLYLMEQNNVVNNANVYTKINWRILQNRKLVQPDMARWEDMLLHGRYDLVRREALKVLEDWKIKQAVNIKALESFYQNFIQIFFRATMYKNNALHDFFVEDVIFEKYIHAHHSVEDMEEFISYAINFLYHFEEQNGNQPYVKKIQEYVSSHLDEEISRTKLAEKLFISPEYLSRLFRKEMGITLSEYITREKLKLAYSYLVGTDISVSDIATKLGYNNFSYFSQVFKKIYNQSPLQVRRNIEVDDL